MDYGTYRKLVRKYKKLGVRGIDLVCKMSTPSFGEMFNESFEVSEMERKRYEAETKAEREAKARSRSRSQEEVDYSKIRVREKIKLF